FWVSVQRKGLIERTCREMPGGVRPRAAYSVRTNVEDFRMPGRKSLSQVTLLLPTMLLLLSCEGARVPIAETYGPVPVLSSPNPSLLPTVDIAPAVGWLAGEQPLPAAGLRVNVFASGLQHPRWLYVLPNGDVLVAESNAPPQEE